MDARSKQLVQDSWTRVEQIADMVATLFYVRLFALDPTLRPLFRSTDFGEQKRKLMQTLTVAVRGLDRLDQLTPALEILGQRHVVYGVRDEHYDTVGEALLGALAQGLGAAFTAETRDAWAGTYDLVASVMKRGAREAAVGTATVRRAA